MRRILAVAVALAGLPSTAAAQSAGGEADAAADSTKPASTPPPTAVPPSEPAAPEPIAVTEKQAAPAEGFGFGSYGRVTVGSDLRGSTPEPANVVAHGTRIVEPTYLELDLYYRIRARRGVNLKTVTTLGFADELFHLTGEFDSTIAIRNFYLEADKGPYSLWAGSRVYSGDDIYLLDFWPIENSNTVGGGASYRQDRVEGGVHVGINRVIDPYFFQERNVLAPGSFGAEAITQLDRQRYVATTRASYRFFGPARGGLAAKAKLYFEAQGVGDGTRELEGDPGVFEQLPADFGYTIGAQLGAWGFGPGASHVNAFAKWSQGLTVFDLLGAPMAVDATQKTFPDANEILLALSGNYELSRGGIMAAAYTRRFIDGDPNAMDRDDGWEYIVDVRPRVDIWRGLQGSLDLSYQVRFPRGISPNELTALDPAVFQIAPMVMYSPFGDGAYARPQFRLLYRAANLNEGARDLYPLDDPRRLRDWIHYVGVQAEWWFNSTYR